MIKNKEILKKKIIYRSTHRGTKEMDLLLGNFVKKNINIFKDEELIELDNMLKIEDEILSKYYYGENIVNEYIGDNKVVKLFKEFKL